MSQKENFRLVAEAIESATGISLDDIISAKYARKAIRGRALLCYYANVLKVPPQSIADNIAVDVGVVYKGIVRHKNLIKSGDQGYRLMVRAIERELPELFPANIDVARFYLERALAMLNEL